MAKLTKMQKEIIEQKFFDINIEINKELIIAYEDTVKLYPRFVEFCHQDPSIILEVLNILKNDNDRIYFKDFIIKKSSIGYPFVELNIIREKIIENIIQCGQRFIEELAFAKSFSVDDIQKTFNKWKQDHVIPKIKILKSIQDYLLIEFTSESAKTMLKKFDERINNVDVNITPLTINKGE